MMRMIFKVNISSSKPGQLVFLVLLLLALLLLGSCQSSHTSTPSRYHTVEKGETLYSIAWKYGKDYRSLARANRIVAPYTIFIDQKIAIRGRKSSNTPDGVTVTKSQSKPRSQQSDSKIVKEAVKETSVPPKWDWPLRGEVLGDFSLVGKVNKGIDIAGKPGSGVKAAADGVVVYAGSNLRGYGKLVIVKHDHQFLSAYGNNYSIRVDEGKKVKAGDVLGRVGSSESNIEMLHFEIRKDGIPVNPVDYLPAQQILEAAIYRSR
jgi:lipoprotein NlpD